MNYFIKQFGKPEGRIGILFGKMMIGMNKKMHKAVLAGIKKSTRVLEIGFGSGSQLEMIHQKYPNIELYGIEISGDMLAMAQKRLGQNANLSLCDSSVTDFENEFFDTIISTDSCYFWNNHMKVLNEIKRISKSGARLILAYNSMYAKSVHLSDKSLGMYDDATISDAIKKAGMRIISQKRCGFCQKCFEIIVDPSFM